VSARAAIVVTGTEVLTGRISDRNGPWLADRLRELGVDLAHVTIVGDRAADMLAALRWCAELAVDLIVTSGGLGPTADDLTAEVVGEFCGREMVLDDELEERIAEILRPLMRRWPHLDEAAIRASNRKQAVVPRGATILEPVGTAPGLVVPPAERRDGPTVVVLPGPPRELQPMWMAALATDAFAAAVAGATTYRQETLRLFGIPESEIAATLRAAVESGVELDRLEITTCLRRGEVEVVTRYEPDARAVYGAFERLVRERHPDTLFSDDGSTVDDQVAQLLNGRGLTVAVAESCTGGLVAARLTERAGASAYVLGGVVAYSDAAKRSLVGVPAELIERCGAVSVEVAAALADGARERFGASLGVGVTGIAGPGGGTPDKPVGLVCFSVAGPGGRLDRRTELPGGRADVRDRSTTVALHMLRRLLLGESDEAAKRDSAASRAAAQS
jgi:nicotinamide-nucleotide amidase